MTREKDVIDWLDRFSAAVLFCAAAGSILWVGWSVSGFGWLREAGDGVLLISGLSAPLWLAVSWRRGRELRRSRRRARLLEAVLARRARPVLGGPAPYARV